MRCLLLLFAKVRRRRTSRLQASSFKFQVHHFLFNPSVLHLLSMVRRIALQVHKQVSRLMRADFIKQQPAWFQAVLDYPPLPLPPKAPSPRTAYDLQPQKPSSTSGKPTKLRTQTPRPLPIHYIEDDIRRQFFRDHPFEAFRPTTLVEGGTVEDAHPIQGLVWTRLRQRGRNPTPEEYACICFLSIASNLIDTRV
jgi:hypothetical protein